MAEPGKKTNYANLVLRAQPPKKKEGSAQDDLDALLTQYQDRQHKVAESAGQQTVDRVQQLREDMLRIYIPAFVDLTEKYAPAGIQLEMDASVLLQGGRELKFVFRVGEYRSEMHGVVTSHAIAFHETTYTPQVGGEIASGPMLRLRSLNEGVFRDFICQRLTQLLRTAMGRR